MTTITRLAPDTQIRIGLDATHDLVAAGYSAEERRSISAAWMAALAQIAEQLGLTDVEGSHTIYGSADEHGYRTSHVVTEDDETIESLLWQAAHDSIRRETDGTWTARTPALVEYERVALRRFIAE